jgi:hypothetical protein
VPDDEVVDASVVVQGTESSRWYVEVPTAEAVVGGTESPVFEETVEISLIASGFQAIDWFIDVPTADVNAEGSQATGIDEAVSASVVVTGDCSFISGDTLSSTVIAAAEPPIIDWLVEIPTARVAVGGTQASAFDEIVEASVVAYVPVSLFSMVEGGSATTTEDEIYDGGTAASAFTGQPIDGGLAIFERSFNGADLDWFIKTPTADATTTPDEPLFIRVTNIVTVTAYATATPETPTCPVAWESLVSASAIVTGACAPGTHYIYDVPVATISLHGVMYYISPTWTIVVPTAPVIVTPSSDIMFDMITPVGTAYATAASTPSANVGFLIIVPGAT